MPANLKQLTSLRFFAALWVVAYHYWPSLTGGYPVLVDKGYLGVELFFVLSGFILAHVYLDDAGAGRLNYGRFLWARLARIYPVHLVTLAAIGLMGALALALGYPMRHQVIVWSVLPQTLLLIHAWGTASVSAWNHPSWSISAEWFAYVFFPLFAAAAWALRAGGGGARRAGPHRGSLSGVRGHRRLPAHPRHHGLGGAAHRAVLHPGLRGEPALAATRHR